MEIRPIDANALQELCNRGIQNMWNTGVAPVSWAAAYADFKNDIDSIPTLTPPNEWVSVEERLPTDERPVLVFIGYADTMTGFITTSSYFCFDVNPHWQWDGFLEDEQRTLFWMPLPEPPDSRPPEGEEDNND